MSTHITEANLSDPSHAAAVAELIDQYAQTPQGQGRPLDPAVKAGLPAALRKHPTTRVFLAKEGEDYVGIAVCFTGFSTFAAKPLLNIHDIYVRGDQRGKGVGRQLLAAVEQAARESGCCKLTLEVMDANPSARAVYERFGFEVGEEGVSAHRFLSKRL